MEGKNLVLRLTIDGRRLSAPLGDRGSVAVFVKPVYPKVRQSHEDEHEILDVEGEYLT